MKSREHYKLELNNYFKNFNDDKFRLFCDKLFEKDKNYTPFSNIFLFLPTNCYIKIFNHLNLNEIKNIMLTCKTFKELLYSQNFQSFWKNRCKKINKYTCPREPPEQWIKYTASIKNSLRQFNRFEFENMYVNKSLISKKLSKLITSYATKEQTFSFIKLKFDDLFFENFFINYSGFAYFSCNNTSRIVGIRFNFRDFYKTKLLISNIINYSFDMISEFLLNNSSGSYLKIDYDDYVQRNNKELYREFPIYELLFEIFKSKYDNDEFIDKCWDLI